ncbi:MAG TPA: ferritin family protein [Polyangiaceae bacterium]|nr:ferritin family protein [Polyangiaceae bacterium]
MSSLLETKFAWILLGASGLVFQACTGDDERTCEDRYYEFAAPVWAGDWAAIVSYGITAEECLSICGRLGDTHYVSCEVSGPEGFEAGGGFGGTAGQGGLGGRSDTEGPAVGGDTAISVACVVGAWVCPPPAYEGRPHASWGVQGPLEGTDARGRWFARAAADEASSIHSFRALARELNGSALEPFRARLRRAAREEARHTRLMSREARRCGCPVPQRRFRPLPQRSLLQLALENVTAGCVNETLAALSMAYQAQHAPDPRLRRIFGSIANDERHHAMLAWDLHDAYLRVLTLPERRELETALLDALDALENSPTAEAFPSDLGLPDQATGAWLRKSLSSELRLGIG